MRELGVGLPVERPEAVLAVRNAATAPGRAVYFPNDGGCVVVSASLVQSRFMWPDWPQ